MNRDTLREIAGYFDAQANVFENPPQNSYAAGIKDAFREAAAYVRGFEAANWKPPRSAKEHAAEYDDNTNLVDFVTPREFDNDPALD